MALHWLSCDRLSLAATVGVGEEERVQALAGIVKKYPPVGSVIDKEG